MEKSSAVTIAVEVVVNRNRPDVWTLWTGPEHVMKWNQASDDWHTPSARNDLTVDGRFTFRMEAKDGKTGFDFGGVYTEIIEPEKIAYTMDDGRRVKIVFSEDAGTTRIVEEFEAESMNSVDMQRAGWQAILENFKRYAESFP